MSTHPDYKLLLPLAKVYPGEPLTAKLSVDIAMKCSYWGYTEIDLAGVDIPAKFLNQLRKALRKYAPFTMVMFTNTEGVPRNDKTH